jgi:hypothetical protein
VNYPIFRYLRDTFLPMLVIEPAEYPVPVEDESLNEELLQALEYLKSSLPCAPPPPPHNSVLLCPQLS